MDDQQASWVNTIPELETRSLLLSYMARNPQFRRAFFRWHEWMAALPGTGIPRRGHLLEYEFRNALDGLEHWRATIEAEDHHIFNEAWGVLRNIHKNMSRRISGHPRIPMFRHEDIARGAPRSETAVRTVKRRPLSYGKRGP